VHLLARLLRNLGQARTGLGEFRSAEMEREAVSQSSE
jgi:hypothetical protein